MLAIPASMEPLELAEAAAHCLALDLLAAEARVAELEGALRVADDEVSYVAGELRGLMANLCGKWRNKCGEWIVRELSVSRPAQNGEDAQNG
jgi:hypothetical protein